MVWFAVAALAQLPPDADYDGVPDQDEDVDGDGDVTNDDSDADGLADWTDPDDDGDSLPTHDETEYADTGAGSADPQSYDTDADGIRNYLDPDDDGDGVDSYCEVMVGLGTQGQVDSDGDTLLDGAEWYNGLLADPNVDPDDALDWNGSTTGLDCSSPWDRDSDGTPNVLDTDDDNDGLGTGTDELGSDEDCIPGTSVSGVGDGVPDYVDADSDNDGILDGDEALGDQDGDFVVDFLDCDEAGCAGDSDQDGILNCDEDSTLCSGVPIECALDPDVDGDAVIDGIEVGGNLAAPQDHDQDAQPDFLDPDDDGDSLTSAYENGIVGCADPALLLDRYQCVDTACTSGYWTFECDDSGGALLRFDFGGNELADYPDVDGDAVPNFLDLDDDGDGLTTLAETVRGIDPYSADSDADGVGDASELDADTDSDGTTDALDPDDDGDGILTLDEGTGDADGDGVPDYLDADGATTPTTPTTPTAPTVDSGAAPADTADKGGSAACSCGSAPGGLGWIAALAVAWRARRRGPRS